MVTSSILLAVILATTPVSPQPSFLKQANVDKCEKSAQFGKEHLYTHATHCYPSIDIEPHLYDEALKDLKEISSGIVTEKQFAEFAESVRATAKDGTCYGGAISFLLSNAKRSISTITLPVSKKEKMRALYFQSLVNANSLLKKKYAKGILYANKTLQWHDFCLALKNQKTEYLTAIGFHSLGSARIKRDKNINDPDNEDFAMTLIDTICQLADEKNATELLICFDLTVGDMRVGHAVLAQLYQKRIYDGGYGIYQFASLSDLVEDLIRYASPNTGSTYFDIEAFGPLPKKE